MASKLTVSEKCQIKGVKILTNKVLGTGSYGVVYAAVYHGTQVAAKKLHGIFFEGVSPAEVKGILHSWQQELELMSSLRHPNIVQFYGVFNSRNSSSLELSGDSYIITELMAKSLQARNLKPPRLNFRQIVDIAMDIASGLCYLHNRDQPIMHRDLASKNILLSVSGQAKIADLGVAKITLTAQTSHTRHPGTDLYMPVETVVGDNDYDHSIDIYGLGVIILELSIGRDPIATQCLRRVEKTFEIVPEKERRQKDFDEFKRSCNSEELESVIMSCLKDKEDRAMASDVVEQLEKLQNNNSYRLCDKTPVFDVDGSLPTSHVDEEKSRLSADLKASKAQISNLKEEKGKLFTQFEHVQNKLQELTTENDKLKRKLKNQEKETENQLQQYHKSLTNKFNQLQNNRQDILVNTSSSLYSTHALQQLHYADNSHKSPRSLPVHSNHRHASKMVVVGSQPPNMMFQRGLSTDSGRSSTVNASLYSPDATYSSQDSEDTITPGDEEEYNQDSLSNNFSSMPTYSDTAPPFEPLTSPPAFSSQVNRLHHQTSNSQYHSVPTTQGLTPGNITSYNTAVFGSSVPPGSTQLTVLGTDSGRSPTVNTSLYSPDTTYSSQDSEDTTTPGDGYYDEEEYNQDRLSNNYSSMPPYPDTALPFEPLTSLPAFSSQVNRPFYPHHQTSNSQHHSVPTTQGLTPGNITSYNTAVFGSSVSPGSTQLTTREADEYLSYQLSCMDRVINQLMNTGNSDNLQSSFVQTLMEQMINTENYIRKMPFSVGNVPRPIMDRIKHHLDILLHANIRIAQRDNHAFTQAIYQLRATIGN
ncbi:probable serine/threonine-protein kinase nek3 [Dysidea avara]|uniref:probable serine/threonine-protein kinase nek3 n=1 Tax=Dysidea avara TaxID=196820 RepID=UPI0033272428